MPHERGAPPPCGVAGGHVGCGVCDVSIFGGGSATYASIVPSREIAGSSTKVSGVGAGISTFVLPLAMSYSMRPSGLVMISYPAPPPPAGRVVAGDVVF